MGSRPYREKVVCPYWSRGNDRRTAPILQHETLRERQSILLIQTREHIERDGDESCPAGLMTRPEARAIVAVEVLIKKDGIASERILLELRRSAIDGTAAGFVAQEDR
jgi:hypothetical protein